MVVLVGSLADRNGRSGGLLLCLILRHCDIHSSMASHTTLIGTEHHHIHSMHDTRADEAEDKSHGVTDLI